MGTKVIPEQHSWLAWGIQLARVPRNMALMTHCHDSRKKMPVQSAKNDLAQQHRPPASGGLSNLMAGSVSRGKLQRARERHEESEPRSVAACTASGHGMSVLPRRIRGPPQTAPPTASQLAGPYRLSNRSHNTLGAMARGLSSQLLRELPPRVCTARPCFHCRSLQVSCNNLEPK